MYFTYTQNKKFSTDIITNEKYEKGRDYVIINKDATISRLKEENKELYDSIKDLSDVKSAIQLKYVYRYATDTVYVKTQVTEEDSLYKFKEVSDTVSYDLSVMGRDVKWYQMNFSLNDSLMIVTRSSNGINKTTITHSSPVDITSATVFNQSQSTWEKIKDKFSVTLGAGVGYGVFNKKTDVFLGLGIGYKLF